MGEPLLARLRERSYFMVKPNGLLVLVSSTYYYAYTSSLSTWSSSTALLRDGLPWEISS
jgi:hypothetical protein